jgi:MraZ protein
LFLGKYQSTLDGQNRLLAPQAIRDQLSGSLYVSQGFDRNLLILTGSVFEEIYKRVMTLNLADPLARLLQRLVLSSARELEINDDGQLSIPMELSEFADLQEKAMLVGLGDFIEIWSLEGWKLQEEELKNSDKNTARFAGLTLATR